MLENIQRMRAIAQTGLTYAENPYDLERYTELHELALGLLAEQLEVSLERVTGVYLPEKGYPTPKIDVRAGVFRDGQILLVRESSDGCWSWCDAGRIASSPAGPGPRLVTAHRAPCRSTPTALVRV